jgi:PAS domain S-box-containing protein
MRQADQESLFTIDVLTLSVPAFGVDMDHTIVAWNAGAFDLFGFSAAEVLGARCYDIIPACVRHDRDCASCCHAVSNARHGRQAQNAQMLMTTRQTTPRWIELSTVIGRSLEGKKRVIHFARDVTERHRVGEVVAQGLSKSAISSSRHVTSERAARANSLPPVQRLTPREREVLDLLACGLDTRTISATLSISPLTARNHVTRVMEKLGATTRLQAVVAASQLHLL